METQTALKPSLIFVVASRPGEQLAQACSRDYGFDFDEEEIVRQMLAPIPVGFSTNGISQAGSDGSEFAQLWFLS